MIAERSKASDIVVVLADLMTARQTAQDDGHASHRGLVLELVGPRLVEEPERRVGEVEHQAVDLRQHDQHRRLVLAALVMVLHHRVRRSST